MSEFNFLKKGNVLGLVMVFVASAVAVFAADNKDIPPWMENVDVNGRSTYLVPKGAKRKVFGSQVIVETPNEYVARRLYEMEEYLNSRFKRIDEAQEAFRKELEDLRQEVERLGEGGRFSADLEDLKKTVEGLKEFKSAAEETLLRLEGPEVVSDVSTDVSQDSQGVIEGILP